MSRITLKRGTLLLLGALVTVALLQFLHDTATARQEHSQSPWKPQRGSLAAANWFDADDPAFNNHEFIASVPGAPSIQEGLSTFYTYNAATQQPGLPFVVRHAREWAHVTRDQLIKVMNESSQVFRAIEYVSPKKQIETEVTAAAAMQQWLQNRSISVVADSPMRPVFPLVPRMLMDENQADVNEAGPSMLLSNSRSFTPLHVDHVENGGGWVWLPEGEKHWVFLSPAWAEHLPTTRSGFRMPTDEYGRGSLLKLADMAKANKQLGPVFVAIAGPGDFLCWPPGYLHGVVTTKRTIGVGAYLRLKTDDQAIRSLPHILTVQYDMPYAADR